MKSYKFLLIVTGILVLFITTSCQNGNKGKEMKTDLNNSVSEMITAELIEQLINPSLCSGVTIGQVKGTPPLTGITSMQIEDKKFNKMVDFIVYPEGSIIEEQNEKYLQVGEPGYVHIGLPKPLPNIEIWLMRKGTEPLTVEFMNCETIQKTINVKKTTHNDVIEKIIYKGQNICSIEIKGNEIYLHSIKYCEGPEINIRNKRLMNLKEQAQKASDEYPELIDFLAERDSVIEKALFKLAAQIPNPDELPKIDLPSLGFEELWAPGSHTKCKKILEKDSTDFDLSNAKRYTIYWFCRNGIYLRTTGIQQLKVKLPPVPKE